MLKKIFTLLFALTAVYGWSQESYTAMKVTGDNVPEIDGSIEAMWDNVEVGELTKVPEVGGQVHSNITEPEPSADDYSAQIRFVWNESGLFFLFEIVDDKIVIEDDYQGTDDQWWTDDNINLLFSKDLVNETFTQWEFAWQPGIDQEEKLSSDEWAPFDIQVDPSLVESAWFNEEDTYKLEGFIDWEAFADGNATITEGMDIYLEARARDDDDSGAWESMYQWSTTNYEIETNGEGFGTVTLAADELVLDVATSGANTFEARVYPNPVMNKAMVNMELQKSGYVSAELYTVNGQQLDAFEPGHKQAGQQSFDIDMTNYPQGSYLLKIKTNTDSAVLRIIKQ